MPILQWLTREEDVRAAEKVPYRLLEEDPKLGYGDKDTENLVIQGDNLDALKSLLPFYAGQVKCIFIDPPYNTRSAFEHYDDNLEHSQWLSMIWPRLELLRELLREDGSIWMTISDNEAHYLKVIADEVFGRSHFVANVIWQKVYSERMDASGFSTSHDHLLVYRKSEAFKLNPILREQNKNQFGFFDEAKKKYYRRRSLRKEGSESLRSDRPSMWYPIDAPDGTKVWPVKPDGTEGRWRWKKENVVLKKDLLDFVRKEDRWEIYVKQFIATEATRPPATLWLNSEVGHTHEAKLEVREFNRTKVFSTPKPERLIERIISIASGPEDIILDSFLGSGTTAAVAHKMNRRYIGIEMGAHAVTHACLACRRLSMVNRAVFPKLSSGKAAAAFAFAVSARKSSTKPAPFARTSNFRCSRHMYGFPKPVRPCASARKVRCSAYKVRLPWHFFTTACWGISITTAVTC